MNGIYPAALGARFDLLPLALRRLHSNTGSRCIGMLQVIWHRNPLLRLLLVCGRLPAPAESVPCRVDIIPGRQSESWRRQIGPSAFNSRFRVLGSGRVREQMGPLCFDLAVRLTPSRCLVQRSNRVVWLGIPMPLQVFSRERAYGEDDIRCDIRVYLRGSGCLLRYRGRLRVRSLHG